MKRNISGIVTLIFLAAAVYFVLPPLSGARAKNNLASQDATLKKELPKEIKLSKDSQSDKYGEAAFNHETHSTKNYSPDGKAIIGCVECHHTDQPASALKPPLKTAERAVVLTLEALKAPGAVGVKTCRSCHLQADDDSKEMPKITYEGKSTATKLTNEEAYHRNCNICHDNAIKARADLKGKIPGSTDCAKCHKLIE